jgi:hypothetical protein
MMAYYGEKLPRFAVPESPAGWEARKVGIRNALLEKVYLKGHRPGILDAPPVVEWRGVIETGKGYRIRKLRYEGYPGMWIPALLYEPVGLKGKAPAVLNPNGHHRGGKAMPYKQLRCINLAKRGMLALNTEFVGMGELQGSGSHMQQGQMDLCGVAGVGVMYLAMKRGLDVLLAHENADPDRVAMTGLSGGGWQTAVLSALDDRIRAIVPVSGHSPIWHRATKRWQDHGDLEQTPSDLCTVADYDALTAMFAPRPSLLVFSRDDEIFRPEFMRPALFEPARQVYRLLGAEDRIEFYTNVDPGTHNYDRDIREQLYRFLKKTWNLDIPTEDLPSEDEVRSEWELSVGLPTGNPTLLSIAGELAGALPWRRASARTPAGDRNRLRKVLRLPSEDPVRAETSYPEALDGDLRVQQHKLSVGRWLVPVSEFRIGSGGGPELIVSDGGRSGLTGTVLNALKDGKRVFVADLFASGEQVIEDGAYHYLFMECVAAAGDRPLGIRTAQLLALLGWIREGCGAKTADLTAQGLSMGVSALCAAALRPEGIGTMRLDNVPDTFRRLMDWSVDYVKEPAVFCFGLLEQFDIQDLVVLSDPVRIVQEGRGPMR